MSYLRRAVFLGACGAALLATLYLDSSMRERPHARDYRRGPEAPAVSGRGRASLAPTSEPGAPRTGASQPDRGAPAARARRNADLKAKLAARAADRAEYGRWQREMRRLDREAARERKQRERDARRAEQRRGRGKPARLFEPPPLGPPVKGVGDFPRREER
jgi:hypothetical protein